MQDDGETLATLTFNTSASREMFAEQAKGLKLRIERGVVTFRSAQRGGIDVVAIERRPRGVRVALDHRQLPKRLMQRLFRAGLTQEQPYFLVEPVSRGWYGIQHYPYDHPPQRQSIMVVSEFDPPPVPVDMSLWNRFRRRVNTQRPVDAEEWQSICRMVLSAVRLVARPQRGGRVSAERQAAHRLLTLVENNESLLMGWAQQEPDVAADVRDMLVQVTGREPEEPSVVEFSDPQPESSEDPADDRPSRRGGRPRKPFPLATTPVDDAEEGGGEPEPERPPTRRRRRTWPQIPQLAQDEPEDLPAPGRSADAESEIVADATEPEDTGAEQVEQDEPVAWDAPDSTDGDFHETNNEMQEVTPEPEPVVTESFVEAETTTESEAPAAVEASTEAASESFVEAETTTESEAPAAVEASTEAASDEAVSTEDDSLEEVADSNEGASEPDEAAVDEGLNAATDDAGTDEVEPEPADAVEQTAPPEAEASAEESEPQTEPEREIDLDKVFARFVNQVRSEGDEPGVTKPETSDPENSENKGKPPGMGDQPDLD